MRVEIIGGMGTGKTTLCQQLSHHGVNCVYEKLQNNPYLDLSYKDPQAFGFYSQMTFVLGNFYQIVSHSKPGALTVFDYSTITDKAYASLFLRDKARDAVLETIACLEEKEGHADLYLNLKCSPEAQLARIRARNRPHEARIDLGFVRNLGLYMDNFVAEAEMKGLNVMTIDTENIDLRRQTSYGASLAASLQMGIEPVPPALHAMA
jgi:deoxyadenosine/deoxycytidine kinase